MKEDIDKPPHRVRLWAVFASDAPKAVILRRGPKTHYQLIGWDLRTDTFTPGQWLKGFVRLWDLSPSGDKLIYWAHQYHPSAAWRRREERAEPNGRRAAGYEPLQVRPRNRSPKRHEKRRRTPRYMREAPLPRWRLPSRPNFGCWTAISTPPYFSALAIWPSFGHWTGGGIFASEREIILREGECGMTPKQNVRIPNWIKFRSSFDIPNASSEPRFSGWQPWMCDCGLSDRISKALTRSGASWVEWVAPREDGALLFACDGSVYRLQGWRDLEPDHYLSRAKKLADFTASSFTLMAAPPDAMRW